MDSFLTKFLLIPCSGLLPLLPLSSVEADVRLPGFYTDHMVLQREMPVRLRGWAEAGERVIFMAKMEGRFTDLKYLIRMCGADVFKKQSGGAPKPVFAAVDALGAAVFE